MNSKTAGQLSKARRVLSALDDLIVLVADDGSLSEIPFKEAEAILVNLKRSRVAAANAMATLGDSSQINTMPDVSLPWRSS